MRGMIDTTSYNNPHYLTDIDVKNWALMPFWLETEAVVLSLGIDPRKRGETVERDKALEISNEFNKRQLMLQRWNETDLKERGYFKYKDNSPETEYDPKLFVQWAKEHFPSFPDKLYNAVVKGVEKTKTEKISNHRPSGGNPGSDARWILKREIVSMAESYVNKSLEDGCEYCDHCQLAEYMFYNAVDDDGKMLFKFTGEKDSTFLKYLREGAQKALKNHPNRIVGKEGYKKSEGVCEVHPK